MGALQGFARGLEGYDAADLRALVERTLHEALMRRLALQHPPAGILGASIIEPGALCDPIASMLSRAHAGKSVSKLSSLSCGRQAGWLQRDMCCHESGRVLLRIL